MDTLPNDVVMILSRQKNTEDWEIWDIVSTEKIARDISTKLINAFPNDEYAICHYIKGQNTLVRI